MRRATGTAACSVARSMPITCQASHLPTVALQYLIKYCIPEKPMVLIQLPGAAPSFHPSAVSPPARILYFKECRNEAAFVQVHNLLEYSSAPLQHQTPPPPPNSNLGSLPPLSCLSCAPQERPTGTEAGHKTSSNPHPRKHQPIAPQNRLYIPSISSIPHTEE